LKEGIHTIYVKAVDKAGNSNIDSVSVIVDLTAPSVLILSPKEGSYINSSALSVSWNGSDNFDIDHYKLRWENDTSSSGWINVGSLTSYSLSGLPEGNITIYVRAYDYAGNMAEDICWVVIDTIPPTLSLVAPENNSWTNCTHINLTWMGSDENLDHYEVKVGSGSWVDVGMNTSYEVGFGEDGEYLVFMRAVDRAGNMNMICVRIFVDISPPVLELLSPQNNSYVNYTQVQVSWEVKYDYSGIDHYEVYYNGSWIDVGLDTNYTWIVDEGINNLYLKAVDNVGNTRIIMVNITADITPPLVTILAPSEGEIIESDTVTVTWNASDNIGIDGFYVRINGGSWIYAGQDTSMTFGDLENGNYTVEVKAIDLAGNSGIDVVTFKIQYTLGVVSLLFEKSEYVVEYSDLLEISVTLLDHNGHPMPGVTIEFYVNDSGTLDGIGDATTDQNGIARITWVADKMPGTYTIYIRCVGLANYEGAAKEVPLTVTREETVIVFLYTIYEVEYSDTLTISCYLRTNDGENLAGKTISFYYINGPSKEFLSDSTTSEDGLATVIFPSSISPGNYTLLAEYAGSEYYNDATSTITINVVPEGMVLMDLKIYPGEVYVGDKVTIELVVAENDYDATRYIANANVTIMLDGEKIASGYTDNNGKFTGEWTPDKAGEFEMKIVIDKQNYETFIYSIKRTVKARVKYFTYLLLAIAAISTMIIAIVVKRKHRVEGGVPIGEVSIEEMEELEAEPLDELE